MVNKIKKEVITFGFGYFFQSYDTNRQIFFMW